MITLLLRLNDFNQEVNNWSIKNSIGVKDHQGYIDQNKQLKGGEMVVNEERNYITFSFADDKGGYKGQLPSKQRDRIK